MQKLASFIFWLIYTQWPKKQSLQGNFHAFPSSSLSLHFLQSEHRKQSFLLSNFWSAFGYDFFKFVFKCVLRFSFIIFQVFFNQLYLSFNFMQLTLFYQLFLSFLHLIPSNAREQFCCFISSLIFTSLSIFLGHQIFQKEKHPCVKNEIHYQNCCKLLLIQASSIE